MVILTAMSLMSSGASAVCWPGFHRYTLNRLRREIEPVTAADFVRFLFSWPARLPLRRAQAVRKVLRQSTELLEGFDVPAGALETDVLPSRVQEYGPSVARCTVPVRSAGLGAAKVLDQPPRRTCALDSCCLGIAATYRQLDHHDGHP